MKKQLLKIGFILLMIFFLLGSIAFYIFFHFVHMNYAPVSFSESARPLSNPYEGWYHIYGYTLSDDSTFSKSMVDKALKTDSSNRLVLLEINLKSYANSSISPSGLAELNAILSAWSSSDKQMIIRFLYDWDGKATQTEPKNINQILSHMNQICPILNSYASHIYLLQGIFVGNTGEMTSSAYMDETAMTKLMQTLSSLTDSSIFLSVRTPQHYRILNQTFTPLGSQKPYDGSLASRVGLFNDGMLGSANDLGTYGSGSLSNATSYLVKGNRSEEIAFQNILCQYVPNGGEVVSDNSYNDLPNAIKDLSAMHISYLDCDYDPAVLSKWKNTTYSGTDLFCGCRGFDYISRHLGYRYVLGKSSLDHTFFSSKATFHLSIKNVGFSPCYKRLKPTLSLVNTDTHTVKCISLTTDNRTWQAGSTTAIRQSFSMKGLKKGTYHVYFSLKDSSANQMITFANTADLTTYGYCLGSLEITK